MKLKALLVMTALLLTATSAFAANWVLISTAKDYKTYYDADSVIKSGNIANFAVLTDYRVIQHDKTYGDYFSAKAMVKINKTKMQYKINNIALYAGLMGDGASVLASKLVSTTAYPIAANSPTESVVNIIWPSADKESDW